MRSRYSGYRPRPGAAARYDRLDGHGVIKLPLDHNISRMIAQPLTVAALGVVSSDNTMQPDAGTAMR